MLVSSTVNAWQLCYFTLCVYGFLQTYFLNMPKMQDTAQNFIYTFRLLMLLKRERFCKHPLECTQQCPWGKHWDCIWTELSQLLWRGTKATWQITAKRAHPPDGGGKGTVEVEWYHVNGSSFSCPSLSNPTSVNYIPEFISPSSSSFSLWKTQI